MRIGHGYDVHRLIKDRPLILGGMNIPHEMGLAGHSDADVLLHAIIDAVLGALALGDIGAHFPDTDPAYLNADSGSLLTKVWKLAQDRGYQLGNLDATVICESPRLSPHIQKMRQRIADILHSPLERISIKATSEEGLGISGSGGIAAHCVILLEKQG